MSPASPFPSPTPFLFEEQDAAPASDWKQEVAHIVAARRTPPANQALPTSVLETKQQRRTPAQQRAERSARIAASVAARYANAPTYSEHLQQQQAVNIPADTQTPTAPPEISFKNEMSAQTATHESLDIESADIESSGIESAVNRELPFETLSAPEAYARILLPSLPERSKEMTLQSPATEPEPALDDFLASSWMTPPVPLAANLIEFPRELVAPRRLRPKYTEGPLRASRAASDPAQVQLRIFEVDPDQSPQPVEPSSAIVPSAPAEEPEPAVLPSIFLGAQPEPAAYAPIDTSDSLLLPLPTAAIHRRVMAFVVDFSFVTGAFFAFLLVFALSTPRLPSGRPAIIMCGIVYFVLWLLYQYLFFSLGCATAGMSYARIALCTFEDENPSRQSLQRRVAAWWIATLPLGLGFVWALLDEDNLGWHDRMTRTYPRSY